MTTGADAAPDGTSKSGQKSTPVKPFLFKASALKGLWVVADGVRLGTLRDLIIGTRPEAKATIRFLIVRRDRKDMRIPADSIDGLDEHELILDAAVDEAERFQQQDGEVRVLADLLDAEAIDRGGPRVVRVNDVIVEWDGERLACAAVDASTSAIFRRLFPGGRSRASTAQTIAWSVLAPMAEPPTGVEFNFSHDELECLHPADIARLIDHLPYRQAARVLDSIDVALAADVLEEVERRRQPEILDYLPPEKAVAILNAMAPDAAADLLEEVRQPRSDRLIALLEPRQSSDVRLLLSYPPNSAAGLMTTEFVMALTGETVAEAVDYVRRQLRRPNLVYYIYVVDNPTDRRLHGVLSLRDLLLAKPGTRLDTLLGETVHTVQPGEHCREVARIMGEYNLLALPVIDELGRLLGLVTADDVLDLMLPESTRRHLPRMFS